MTHRTRRHLTADRGPPDGPEIHVVEQIGPKRAKTPNGNLVLYDVPIARVGWMLYDKDEVPVEANEQGFIRIYRGPEQLFRPETLGSCMGIAVTDDHPEGYVTPANHRELGCGFSFNVRRGEGEDSDVILSDLLITDQKIIDKIMKDQLEISLGYEAEYVQKERGVGEQVDIIGNHIALVERGRCGPRCSIGDRAPTSKEKGKPMTQRNKMTPATRVKLRQLIKDADTLLEESSDGTGGSDEPDASAGGTHIHIHSGGGGGDPTMGNQPKNLSTDNDNPADPGAGGDPVEQRFVALEGAVQQLQTGVAAILEKLGGGGGGEEPAADPTKDEFPDDLKKKDEDDPTKDSESDDEDDDKRKLTGDSAALSTGYQSLLADAEVLVPGIRVATFDAKAARKLTVDRMCQARRRTLDAFYLTAGGKEVVDALTGKKDLTLDSASCQEVATVFRSAAAAQRLLNNRAATKDSKDPGKKIDEPVVYKPMTIAEINAKNKAYWDSKQTTPA